MHLVLAFIISIGIERGDTNHQVFPKLDTVLQSPPGPWVSPMSHFFLCAFLFTLVQIEPVLVSHSWWDLEIELAERVYFSPGSFIILVLLLGERQFCRTPSDRPSDKCFSPAVGLSCFNSTVTSSQCLKLCPSHWAEKDLITGRFKTLSRYNIQKEQKW